MRGEGLEPPPCNLDPRGRRWREKAQPGTCCVVPFMWPAGLAASQGRALSVAAPVRQRAGCDWSQGACSLQPRPHKSSRRSRWDGAHAPSGRPMPGCSVRLLLPETQSLGDPGEGTQDPSAAPTATGKSVLLSGEMKAVLLEERKPLLAFQARHRSRHLSHRWARETQKDTAAGSCGHPRDRGPDFLGPGVSWPEWGVTQRRNAGAPRPPTCCSSPG